MVLNPAITAQLTRERQRDLMGQAQRHRLAAQARLSSRPRRRQAGQLGPRWHQVLLRAIRPVLPGTA